MRKVLLKLLNIEDSEFIQVLLLLLMGFCIGIFLATYNTSMSALFVTAFDEATDLPLAMVGQGIVGIVITSLFSHYQRVRPYARLSLVVLIIITLSIFSLRLGYGLIPDKDMRAKLVFFGFMLMVPFEALVLLIFWGMIARIFDLKQQKRIVGGVDIGKGLATLVAFFGVIPIANSLMETIDLLEISFASTGLLIFVHILLVRNSPAINFVRMEAHEKTTGKLSIPQMFKDNYIIWLIGFVMIVTIAGNFIDYSFLNTATKQFPREKDLVNFIGVFQGITLVFSMLAQTFVGDWLVENYGLKITLLINALLLILFTVLTVLAGSFFGFTPGGDNNFIFFFMAVALSSLFFSALKDAFDEPTFKFFLFPIDKSIRLIVMTRLDGIVKVTAGMIAGLLMLAIDKAKFFNLLSFSYILLLIIGAWIYIIIKMHTKYQESLRATLEKTQQTNDMSSLQSADAIGIILEKELESDHPEKVIFILKFMEKTEPVLFERSLKKLEASANRKLRNFVSAKVKNLEASTIDSRLVSETTFLSTSSPSATDRPSARFNLRKDYTTVATENIHHEEVIKLAKSKKTGDRVMAAKLMRIYDHEETTRYLIQLLKDYVPLVKMEAIITARKVQRSVSWTVLIDLLASPEYGNMAAASLVECGDRILPVLEHAFYKSGQSELVMIKIVQIYGHIGSKSSIELLWNKINHPAQDIIDQVLLSLSYCNAEVPEERVPAIINILEIEIGDAAWDLAAMLEVDKRDETVELRASLKEEIRYNFNSIFRLLSLIYDSQSIELVQQSLDSEETEGKLFAIELLDMFLDENLKPILFPLLEDIPVTQKIAKLQNYFPRITFDHTEVLKHLITRDYRYTNRWTRACAMFALAHLENLDEKQELVANLFHKDNLLRETAAWALYQLDKPLFDRVSPRLHVDIKEQLEEKLGKIVLQENTDIAEELLYNRVLFLKKVALFNGVPGDILAEISDIIQPQSLPKGEKLILNNEEAQKCLFILAKGNLHTHNAEGKEVNLNEAATFGSLLMMDASKTYDEAIASEDSLLYAIDQHEFFARMSTYPELVRGFIHNVNVAFDYKSLDIEEPLFEIDL
ncbi:cyclic nucleotide-binding domain-containing protein [Microscilla marina]|nr:cyclic nucleotide-binding domain-containing protein [Microscilla marina]